jgi:hypothetical protein
MIGAWSINVGGRLYGPFTSERMKSFASEGRLAPHSLVAREGTSDWHEAREEPEFSDLFVLPSREPAVPALTPQPAEEPAPITPPAHQTLPQRADAGLHEKSDGSRSHFAIVIDQKSRPAGNLDDAIVSLGPAYRLLHNVWIVSTDQTVNAVRNRLVQELGKADSLFVVDASRGKAAWFNFGPEADVRIRRVWQKAS